MKPGVSGGAVGLGLQAGRLRVSFSMVTWEFFDNPSGLRLTQPLREMSTRNISWFVKVSDR